MLRSDYVLALEITTLSPLSHGAGTDGNQSIARTTEVLVEHADPDTGRKTPRKIRVPCVTGSSLRATLREHAFGHMAEVLGLRDGDVSLDALRLLLKGGKNDAGGASVSLEEARRLRALFPMLAVFGSMDGGMPIRGELRVSQVLPWCVELHEAGLLPTEVRPLVVSLDGAELQADTAGGPIFADRQPVPLHLLLTEEEYFRHDLRTSPHAPLLGGAVRAQVEDKAAARKGKSATAEVRREANESMPHTMEAICTGAPMVATLRLFGATPMEWECLAYALTRWVQHGALLGGSTGKGHGRCRVRVAGALCSTPSTAEPCAPSTAVSVDRAGDLYVRHVLENAAELRAELGKVTRGSAKPAKGKAAEAGAVEETA